MSTARRKSGGRKNRPLQHLDPMECTNIAYAFHIAGDASLAGTPQQILAQEIYRTFMSLTARAGTLDEAFLLSIRALVLSLSRDITNRKRSYLEELQAIKDERETESLRTMGSNVWGTLVNNMFSSLKYVFTALLALLISFIAEPHIPQKVAEQTGQSIPIAAMIILAVLLTKVGVYFWKDTKDARFAKKFSWRRIAAEDTYEEGKLNAIVGHQAQLVREWQIYTGRKFKPSASYKWIQEGDHETRKKNRETLAELDTAQAVVLLRLMRDNLSRVRTVASTVYRRLRRIPETATA